MTGPGGVPHVAGPAARPLVLPRATLGFGGIAVRFRSEAGDVRFAVAPPHDVFLLDDAAVPDCDLVVAFGDATPAPGPAGFSAGGQWELRTHETGGDEICFFGRVDGPESEPITRLRLDRSLRTGTVSTRLRAGDGDTFVIGYPLDEYVAGRLLGRAGAVVLHATAILDGDEAIVFAGHSGAGKSTIAKIAEDCGGRVLSDDRTIIRVDDAGRARAYGTPWHGSLKRGDPSGAEVRAVYLLSQARYDAVEELSAAEALAELYVRLIQPSVDATEAANAIDTVGRLVSHTRIARLHFRPAASAYEVARCDRGVPVAARDGTA